MNVYEKNLEALQKVNPALATEIAEKLSVEEVSGECITEATEYWNGRSLQNPVVCLWLGLDPYILLKWLEIPNHLTECNWVLDHSLKPMRFLLQHADVADKIDQGKLRFVHLNGQAVLADEFRPHLQHRLLYTAALATHVFSDSPSYREEPERYIGALNAYGEACESLLQFAGNSPWDSFVGLENMLANVENLALNPGVTTMYDAFQGLPAVIVATGPSLTEECLPFLREVQDRAVIFSVDASLKYLLENGIRPHFVTTIERVAETLPFFEGLDPESVQDTWQISFPVVLPEAYELYPGPKMIMFRRFSHFAPLLGLDQGTLDAGPSTANMAFVLAKKFGCGPVALIGCDFAYGPTGDTHSEAMYLGKQAEVELSQPRFCVPGVCAEVETNATWDGFRTQLQRDIATFGGPVFNLSAGAYIHGTTQMDEKGGFRPSEPIDVPVIIRKRLQGWTPDAGEEWLKEWYDQKLPAIAECLDTACQDVAKHLEAARALSGEIPVEELNKFFGELFGWYSKLFGEGLLYNSAAHIVQSEWIRALVEHHHTPFVASDDSEAASARILLHCQSLEKLNKMFCKLKELYERKGNKDASTFF